MINPQVAVTPPKHSFRNLRKFLPQIRLMGKEERIAEEDIDKEDPKKPITAATIIAVFKDEKVHLKV